MDFVEVFQYVWSRWSVWMRMNNELLDWGDGPLMEELDGQSMVLFKKNFYLFVYLWLCWVLLL